MLRVIVGALALALVGCGGGGASDAPVTTSSPGGESTAPSAAAAAGRNNALVRVVHAIPAEATLDIYADTNRVFESLGYKRVTEYRELGGARYTFRLRPAGLSQAEPLASSSAGLDGGDHYTIFVLPGDDDAAALRVADDEHVDPANPRAHVRIVQGSRDAGEVDVYAVGRNAPLFESVNFQDVTRYREVEPFTGSLELRPAAQPEGMLTVPNISFAAGRSYTVVITGRVRTSPPLEVFLVEDRRAGSASQ